MTTYYDKLEKERDGLKDAMRSIVDTHKLNFLSGRIGHMLVSIAREALAKLEVSDGMENKADRR